MDFKKIITFGNFIALFAFFMPISEKLSTILIVVSTVILLTELTLRRTKFEWKKEFILLPFLYVVYVCIAMLLSDEIKGKWFEYKASLLIFPLLFSTNKKIDFVTIFKFFVYGCIAAYFICLGNALLKTIINENGIGFNPLINPDRGFFEAVVYEGNYFFGTHFSFLLQTSYFAMYLLLALCILAIYNRYFSKKIVYLGFVVMVLGILQTMSIAGILSSASMFFLGIFLFIKSAKYKIALSFILVSSIILSFLFHPRLKMLKDSIYYVELKHDTSKSNPKMIRIVNWQTTLKIISGNLLMGVGLGNAQALLNTEYEKRGFPQYAKRKLNSHNQYFQVLLECGIVGSVLLLLILFQLARNTRKLSTNERLFTICFLVIICFNFLFESILNRYIGISFFSFFVCIIYRITPRVSR